MMKTQTLVSVLSLCCLTYIGCKPNNGNEAQQATLSANKVYIPVDSANRMIQSYLSSVEGVDSQLHSLIMDVDSLRLYFSDTSIRKVKLMFAHTLSYINSGNEGVPAAYGQDALTLVLAGVDRNGDYVLYHNNTVPDDAVPCPRNCWKSGTAASDLLPTIPNLSNHPPVPVE